MEERTIHSAPTRGTIVVDNSSLYLLHGETSKGFKADGTRWRFYDILPFLAEHGFRVIIPDVVAFEAERVLASGEAINDAFTRNRTPQYRPELEKFLIDIAGGKYPNVLMPICQGPRPVKKAMTALQKALYRHQRGDNNSLTRIIRVQSLMRHAIDRKGIEFGDEAIESIIGGESPLIIKDRPVFVLSDDIKFFKKIAHKENWANVGFLTTWGLFDALTESGVFKRIPCIDPHLTADTMKTLCDVQEQKIWARKLHKPQGPPKESPEGLVDIHITNRQALDYFAKHFAQYKGEISYQANLEQPFLKELKALAKDIKGLEQHHIPEDRGFGDRYWQTHTGYSDQIDIDGNIR